jgi:hypothetical protein
MVFDLHLFIVSRGKDIFFIKLLSWEELTYIHSTILRIAVGSSTSVYLHWGMDRVSCSRLVLLIVIGPQTSLYQHWRMGVVSFSRLISMIAVVQ